MIRILIEKEMEYIATAHEYQRIADSGNPTGDGPKYGYVPIEKPQTKMVKLLEQFVPDDLDLPAVIAVINGLEKKA